ncbi:hypothetical protein BH20CHL7_BH20CHL7_13180 [soil metagenome]
MTARVRSFFAVVVLTGFVGSLAACEPASQATVPVEGIAPVECVGIPEATCREVVAGARGNAAPGTFPVSIRAVCAQPECTAASGDVQVDVQYSDGRRETYNMGWAGPAMPGDGPDVPEPGLTVEPICQGVPAVQCREMALGATGGGPDGLRLLSIVVVCTRPPCTATSGDGDSIATYEDGTRLTSGWSYRN